MKKAIFLAVITLTCGITVSAQKSKNTSKDIIWGVRAGLNFANVSQKYENITQNGNTRTSFHLGVVADFPQSDKWSIQGGVYISEKGYKISEDDDKINSKPLYLEIPVLGVFHYDFSDKAQLQIMAGPYFAYGLGGNTSSSYRGDVYDSPIFSENGQKRFDLGPHIGAGVLLSKNYYVGLAYEFSLINNIDNDKATLKNQNILLSVGYNF